MFSRISNRNVARLLALLMALSFLVVLTACSTAAVNTRMDYWREAVNQQLPIGASKAQAEAFFAERGAALKCCVSMSREKNFHYISERKVGYSLFMDYDVVVLVEFSSEEKVTSVKVQSWGIGL